MGQLADLEINEHETLGDRMIEYQVDIKMITLKGNPLLTGDEGEPFAQFQQKRLKVV
jgi:hypothetical protein